MMKKDEGLRKQICQYPPISNLLTSWSCELEKIMGSALQNYKTKFTDLTHQLRAEIVAAACNQQIAEAVAAVHVFIHTQWTEGAPESFSQWQTEMDQAIYWRALQQVWSQLKCLYFSCSMTLSGALF